MPFLKQLLKKMSAKLGRDDAAYAEIQQRPGACSREEPQPKFSPATRISALAVVRLVEHEIGLLRAARIIAQSANR